MKAARKQAEKQADSGALNIRAFPVEVHRKCKIKAIETGISLRKFVILALEQALEDGLKAG